MSSPANKPEPGKPLPLAEVEKELNRQLAALKEPGVAPVQWARMSNLVIYCTGPELPSELGKVVPDIVTMHPARVLMLEAEPGPESAPVTAAVNVWSHKGEAGAKTCSEQITLRARGDAVFQLPFAVRGLLIGDLPINVWWAAPIPPPLGGPILFDLTEHAQQVIYDSIGWAEPARGVAATATWLPRFEHDAGEGVWSVASDLNWRRLKYWRRLLGQALDPTAAPGALDTISEVLVEHGPHAVVQAWELVSWLASRLGWQVDRGKVQPGVEIAWQLHGKHGPVRVRIDRLAEGPPYVRRVRIACTISGKPGALNATVEDERRLKVELEGQDVAPRTVTIQPQPLAELVARQLSDRERDPVFRESMAVAQIFAQTVLHS
jgi:glucose-6-phosphate dehydrogenase assembly protein OpcA